MGELLLITDDRRRTERLARAFGASPACRIHDLYDDEPVALRPTLIVSDVEALTSDALVRLRRILGQVRAEAVPYPFLVHGNVARAEAQAQILGASGTLSATASAQQWLATVDLVQARERPLPAAVRKRASEVRCFVEQVLLSGRPITPTVAEAGTDLVVHAVRESGIRVWIGVKA